MIRHRFLCAMLAIMQAVGVAGCNRVAAPNAPITVDLQAQTVRGEKPVGPDGACWAKDETPAVIETVTEQIVETGITDGDVGYRTETRQEIVQPREKIWFRTPCEGALTDDVVATLQRALAARGYYKDIPNGVLDPATRKAIRAFQMPRGLNSDRLSLAAARDLGVVASDFGQIEGQ